MLSPDELQRRLTAARTLRGMGQTELAGRLKEDGLGLHDLGRIERGEKQMQATHRRAIAHHLRVPEAWFLDPEVDNLVGLEPDTDTIKNRLDAILDRLTALEMREDVSDLEDVTRTATSPPAKQPPARTGRQ